MGLRNYVIDFLGRIFDKGTGAQVDVNLEELTGQVATKELALQSAINLIGNAIALSKFETYSNGQSTQKEDYYMLNLKPNQNEAATTFWKKAIAKLIINNECLIIKRNDNIYIADSFTRTDSAFYENTYKDIIVNGFKLSASYKESEVIHFKNNNQNAASLITSLYNDYGKIIELSKASYKRNNAKRGVLKIGTAYPQTEDAQKKLKELIEIRLKEFYKADAGAILPLTAGLEYDELSKESYKNGTDSRDIKNLMDDVFEFVARAFQIPPQLLKGTGTEITEQLKAFVNLCIDPLAKNIENELNAKLYVKSDYLNNTYVKVNTNKVKVTSLADIANAIDILTRNGVHNIDENRELIGKEPLRTAESKKHHITKNYEELK
jgi:HK97 family phage portal protein